MIAQINDLRIASVPRDTGSPNVFTMGGTKNRKTKNKFAYCFVIRFSIQLQAIFPVCDSLCWSVAKN